MVFLLLSALIGQTVASGGQVVVLQNHGLASYDSYVAVGATPESLAWHMADPGGKTLHDTEPVCKVAAGTRAEVVRRLDITLSVGEWKASEPGFAVKLLEGPLAAATVYVAKECTEPSAIKEVKAGASARPSIKPKASLREVVLGRLGGGVDLYQAPAASDARTHIEIINRNRALGFADESPEPPRVDMIYLNPPTSALVLEESSLAREDMEPLQVSKVYVTEGPAEGRILFVPAVFTKPLQFKN